jgi:hypothetical protein
VPVNSSIEVVEQLRAGPEVCLHVLERLHCTSLDHIQDCETKHLAVEQAHVSNVRHHCSAQTVADQNERWKLCPAHLFLSKQDHINHVATQQIHAQIVVNRAFLVPNYTAMLSCFYCQDTDSWHCFSDLLRCKCEAHGRASRAMVQHQ